ncbi:hypothetical protein Q8G38_09075 [Halomonas venusta]|uniref:hypothetical protein n=1 Tax=Vreelandella venusta TaxID=44935 RepID=UPI00295E3EAC|nr:hypothetical protein [Halomonas venusta]MDW0359470.1 hypothetical protein [Halomonas venusta]
MKKYRISPDDIAMEEHEDGGWVPASVAQGLYDELWFVLSRIDGDLRATARDINNSNASGNDIYDDCDFLEEHVRAVLDEVDKEE